MKTLEQMSVNTYPLLSDSAKRLFLITNRLSEDKFIDIICKELGVNDKEVTSKVKTRDLAEARFIIAYNIRNYYKNLTLKKIGEILGNRDHSTVLYALSTYKDLYKTNYDFREKANRVIKLLQGD